MTSIIRYTHWVILRTKRPRISIQPTQFQNLGGIFKNEFPGNWTKSWISPESAWFTDSFSIFEIKKIAHGKKLSRFLLPEFNLSIGNKADIRGISCNIIKIMRNNNYYIPKDFLVTNKNNSRMVVFCILENILERNVWTAIIFCQKSAFFDIISSFLIIGY